MCRILVYQSGQYLSWLCFQISYVQVTVGENVELYLTVFNPQNVALTLITVSFVKSPSNLKA